MIQSNNQAIFLRIAHRIADAVLAGEYAEGSRLPSVRDYAAMVQVNPNTAMRAYEYLASKEVVFNRRGIGFFVADGAGERIRASRREQLLSQALPDWFAQLASIGVTPGDLASRYSEFLNSQSDKQS